MTRPDDDLFDRRLQAFLAERAEEVARAADGEETMVVRLVDRLGSRAGLFPWARSVRGLALALLLIAALLVALFALGTASRPRTLRSNGLLTWINETDIRVSDLARPGTRSLIHAPPMGPGDVCCAVAWSPDGRRIALEQGSDLVVMDADGSNPSIVVAHSTLPSAPVWSPDGSKIAFAMIVQGWFQIVVINADGSDLHQVSHGVLFGVNPSWSPDGGWLAFGGIRLPPGVTSLDQNSPTVQWSLFEASVDGAVTRSITDGTPVGWQISQWSSGPAWSPDGRQLVFDARGPQCCLMRLYLVNADGTGLRRIADDSVNPSNPAWAPDGTRIAFQSWRSPDSNEIGPNDLYEIRPDGTGLARIGEDTGPFVWAPDATMIAYAHLHYGSWSSPPGAATSLDSGGHEVQGQGWSQLWVADADGSRPRLVDGNGVTNGISWQAAGG